MKPRKYRQPQGKYLEHRQHVRVRFQEVDSLRIVWHGHYLSYFEDARVSFGQKYQLDYLDIRHAGYIAPIVHISCDFIAPASYGDELEITIRLLYRDSPKLDYFYEVRRLPDRELLATGRTIQILTDHKGNLMLTRPSFLRNFYSRHENRWMDNHE
jgi:acyl-CoA thioester hydrolase